MMDEDVFRTDRADHVAVIGREVLEPGIRRFDEDLGRTAGGAQRPLDPHDLVADGISVPERGEDLVDAAAAHADLEYPPRDGASAGASTATAGPAGGRARLSCAGGRFRRRRANQPGSGSILRGLRPDPTELERSSARRANIS